MITRELILSEDAPIASMAARARDFLAVSLDDQYSWRNSETALAEWRKSIQAAGVFVFKDAFREDEYSGFSLFDDVFPIIYVNNSSAKTRQVFTLFHELAHLLFHTSGIDTLEEHYVDALQGREKHIEVVCNRFASQIVVPDAAFDDAIENYNHSEHTAEMLADKFSVSREMIYRKFVDRRWIDQAEYERAARKWGSQLQRGGSGGDYYRTTISYLGSEYISLALNSYHQNKIDDEKLGEYLNTKPKNVGALAERFLTRKG